MQDIVKKTMKFDRKSLSDKDLLAFYKALIKPRLIEEKMLILLRQGKISKWFSGYGQEASSVGATLAMDAEEFLLPMHRNLGLFTTRGIPLERLFAQFQGKEMGFTHGRDRSFHFGSKEHRIVGMISHLGPQLGIADGLALAHVLAEEKNAVLVVTGDGGASEGDFHEAINVAAVWDLPVIFLIENNRWGLSTPSREQFRCKQFIDKAIGYGMDAVQVDGNNILAVYHTIKSVRSKMVRKPRPFIVECMTFRMRGHEEASGTKYYPEGMQDQWAKQDPVSNFETFLIKEKVLSTVEIDTIRQEVKEEINAALDVAFDAPEISVSTEKEYGHLFAAHTSVSTPQSGKKAEKRMIDAISEALQQAMEKHQKLVLMGQDIAEYGGAFKVTEGFVEKFGKARVRNTPLCESAIVGAALGLSMKGYKAMVEMQFADFVTCGFNQIVNNLAKIHYRWQQNADVVVRMPTGAGVAAGPFHSQSNEAWFFHTPGLRVVYPAFPSDAKGLLLAAFEDPNPVMFFEHKALYRSIKEEVCDDYYTVEIGKGRLVKEGNDVSIITYGMGVHWALEHLNTHPAISADLIDLRTLLPFDKEMIIASVNKTGRALVLHEDTLIGGIGGELSAVITEACFKSLDAPIMRVASLDTPVPFAAKLEDNFLPKQRFAEKLAELLAY